MAAAARCGRARESGHYWRVGGWELCGMSQGFPWIDLTAGPWAHGMARLSARGRYDWQYWSADEWKVRG